MSMIQFNLLPDVKKEYIKARRQKRLILSISTLSAGAAVVIVLILFSFVQFAQKESIKDLERDIDKEISSIESIQGLDEILTIQSQLEALPELHADKPETSRVFSYLSQLTPAEVRIGSVQLDLEESTLTLEGTAPDLAIINRFADTLKFSKFKSVDKAVDAGSGEAQEDINEAEEMVPFTNVVTNLSRNEESSSYEIRLEFDPVLFDTTKDVVLIIPEIITTRSTQGKPNLSDQGDNPLFEEDQ